MSPHEVLLLFHSGYQASASSRASQRNQSIQSNIYNSFSSFSNTSSLPHTNPADQIGFLITDNLDWNSGLVNQLTYNQTQTRLIFKIKSKL